MIDLLIKIFLLYRLFIHLFIHLFIIIYYAKNFYFKYLVYECTEEERKTKSLFIRNLEIIFRYFISLNELYFIC